MLQIKFPMQQKTTTAKKSSRKKCMKYSQKKMNIKKTHRIKAFHYIILYIPLTIAHLLA